MAQAERAALRRDPNGAAYRALRARLIAGRKAAGLTQEAVAERLGRPQSFVAKVERGERSLDVVEFVALCRAINLHDSEVLAAIRQRV
jgi:transcriptional regulator with XRE-family HTH domain